MSASAHGWAAHVFLHMGRRCISASAHGWAAHRGILEQDNALSLFNGFYFGVMAFIFIYNFAISSFF